MNSCTFRSLFCLVVLSFSCALSGVHAAPGDVDLSFDGGSGIQGTVNAVALQPDGKVLIGGEFTSGNGPPRTNLARLNVDGSADGTFDPGVLVGHVRSIALQVDGKMLVRSHQLVRLNADGQRDPGFNLFVVGGDYAVPLAAAVQPDGKVLVAGYTVTEIIDPEGYIGYVVSHFLTRTFANGTHDGSFDVGTGPNADVSSIVVQPDGKVLIGGNFNYVNGVTRSRITRLNHDGTLDLSFDPSADANGHVQSIAVQSDGKVLIAGDFGSVNGTNRTRIARLNANGTLDESFNPGTGI